MDNITKTELLFMLEYYRNCAEESGKFAETYSDLNNPEPMIREYVRADTTMQILHSIAAILNIQFYEELVNTIDCGNGVTEEIYVWKARFRQ